MADEVPHDTIPSGGKRLLDGCRDVPYPISRLHGSDAGEEGLFSI
jgi:hypothetical protein